MADEARTLDSRAHAAALTRVRAFLRDAGVPDEEIDRALENELLDLLVADRVLVPAERRYTEDEVSRRTGMPVELARRFWRALGFSDVGPDDRTFTDLDVDAILILNGLLDLGVVELDSALQLARVIGSSMARIADAEVWPALTGGGPIGPVSSDDSVIAADVFVRLGDQTLPAMGRLLEFAWRRHVQAATRRAMLLRSRGAGALPTLCVGFADMVGFTTLSQHLLVQVGDYYGPVVNLAHAVVALAEPGSVLLSDDLRERGERLLSRSQAREPDRGDAEGS